MRFFIVQIIPQVSVSKKSTIVESIEFKRGYDAFSISSSDEIAGNWRRRRDVVTGVDSTSRVRIKTI